MKKPIVFILFFLLVQSAFAQVKKEEGWYRVTETSDSQYWSLNQNIHIRYLHNDTFNIQGIGNTGASVAAYLKDKQIKIPEQKHLIIPFGGKENGSSEIIIKGEGNIEKGKLNLQVYLKWEGLEDFMEIKVKSDYYLPDQMDKARVSDTILNDRYFQYVLYSLNKRPYQIGEVYTNSVKNGLWYIYNQQGELVSKSQYRNDTLHGWSESYYHYESQSSRKIEGVYHQGIAIGEFKYYNEKRRGKWKLVGSVVYDAEGNKVISRIYHKNGQVSSEVYFDKSGKEVWYKTYSKKGKLLKNDDVPPDIIPLVE